MLLHLFLCSVWIFSGLVNAKKKHMVFHDVPRNWNEAEYVCEQQNQELMHISKDDSNAVEHFKTRLDQDVNWKNESYWTAVTAPDPSDTNYFQRIDCSPNRYFPMQSSQKSCCPASMCVYVDHRNNWLRSDCADKRKFICSSPNKVCSWDKVGNMTFFDNKLYTQELFNTTIRKSQGFCNKLKINGTGTCRGFTFDSVLKMSTMYVKRNTYFYDGYIEKGRYNTSDNWECYIKHCHTAEVNMNDSFTDFVSNNASFPNVTICPVPTQSAGDTTTATTLSYDATSQWIIGTTTTVELTSITLHPSPTGLTTVKESIQPSSWKVTNLNGIASQQTAQMSMSSTIVSTYEETRVISTAEGPDVASTYTGTIVASTAEGTNVVSTAEGPSVASRYRETVVASTVEGMNISTVEGTHIASTVEGANVVSTAEGLNVTPTYKDTNLVSTVEGTNVIATVETTNVVSIFEGTIVSTVEGTHVGEAHVASTAEGTNIVSTVEGTNVLPTVEGTSAQPSRAEVNTASRTSATTTESGANNLKPIFRHCMCITQSSLTTSKLNAKIAVASLRLTVDKTNLSSFVRRKTCATDDRPVSMQLGTVGVTVLIFVFGSIILCDITRVASFNVAVRHRIFPRT